MLEAAAVTAAAFALAVAVTYLSLAREGPPCSLCGTPARVRPYFHPKFGPVCRPCGKFCRLSGG